MNYGYKKETTDLFCDVIEKTKKELLKEGFGVLTEIDVKKTLKEKLNIDYNDYVILGACNPKFAYDALEKEKSLGLLLPCNIVLSDEEGKVFVSTILPTALMNITDNTALLDIAKIIEEKLKKVVDNVTKK